MDEFTIPNAFQGLGDYQDGFRPRSKRELAIVAMEGLIREKQGWKCKALDETIAQKWKEELSEQSDKRLVEYAVKEIQWQAREYASSLVDPAAIEGTYCVNDIVLPDDIERDFKDGIRRLEDVPESKIDYHPGSNNQVIDLVHPSLYCLVYGKTRHTRDAHAITSWTKMDQSVMLVPPENNEPYESVNFQWLPAELQVSEDGKSVQFKSYINNLHPHVFGNLYKSLEYILGTCMVPLFEKVLTDMVNDVDHRIEVFPYEWYEKGSDGQPEPGPAEEGATTEAPAPVGEADAQDVEEPVEEAEGDQEEWVDDDNDDDDDEEDEWENRVVKQPKIPEFKPPAGPKHVVRLNGKRLQVIVKLANIVLTPEKPTYNGGSWHVEGMMNERIVATGILYYDIDNIKDSRLQFRRPVGEPDYEQSDDRGVHAVYGLEDESILVENMGSVDTNTPNRAIAFPNLYQHRVQPFELLDKTKPGIRKILVFFLVNPQEKIISTATVPPQQAEWYRNFDMVKPYHPLSRLPDLALDGIIKWMAKGADSDTLMTMEQAKEYRRQLIEERSGKMLEANEELYERF
ncbi:hypothetical protein SmJEL517_g00889 [Synchytrium microbalum]|uniref:Uncharacterized protein n=1 Tax=Synchytrium microbalum TaxID=1806994 RepID=A0A507C5W4_9FUNG|nr:uncharacterized protein SmJEL517_g00889 [Synchytrium microbalum]TPX36980.1 hypothetical protein SmJEL517_g00889 [Synchytrium microbalum]